MRFLSRSAAADTSQSQFGGGRESWNGDLRVDTNPPREGNPDNSDERAREARAAQIEGYTNTFTSNFRSAQPQNVGGANAINPQEHNQEAVAQLANRIATAFAEAPISQQRAGPALGAIARLLVNGVSAETLTAALNRGLHPLLLAELGSGASEHADAAALNAHAATRADSYAIFNAVFSHRYNSSPSPARAALETFLQHVIPHVSNNGTIKPADLNAVLGNRNSDTDRYLDPISMLTVLSYMQHPPVGQTEKYTIEQALAAPRTVLDSDSLARFQEKQGDDEADLRADGNLSIPVNLTSAQWMQLFAALNRHAAPEATNKAVIAALHDALRIREDHTFTSEDLQALHKLDPGLAANYFSKLVTNAVNQSGMTPGDELALFQTIQNFMNGRPESDTKRALWSEINKQLKLSNEIMGMSKNPDQADDVLRWVQQERSISLGEIINFLATAQGNENDSVVLSALQLFVRSDDYTSYSTALRIERGRETITRMLDATSASLTQQQGPAEADLYPSLMALARNVAAGIEGSSSGLDALSAKLPAFINYADIINNIGQRYDVLAGAVEASLRGVPDNIIYRAIDAQLPSSLTRALAGLSESQRAEVGAKLAEYAPEIAALFIDNYVSMEGVAQVLRVPIFDGIAQNLAERSISPTYMNEHIPAPTAEQAKVQLAQNIARQIRDYNESRRTPDSRTQHIFIPPATILQLLAARNNSQQLYAPDVVNRAINLLRNTPNEGLGVDYALAAAENNLNVDVSPGTQRLVQAPEEVTDGQQGQDSDQEGSSEQQEPDQDEPTDETDEDADAVADQSGAPPPNDPPPASTPPASPDGDDDGAYRNNLEDQFRQYIIEQNRQRRANRNGPPEVSARAQDLANENNQKAYIDAVLSHPDMTPEKAQDILRGVVEIYLEGVPHETVLDVVRLGFPSDLMKVIANPIRTAAGNPESPDAGEYTARIDALSPSIKRFKPVGIKAVIAIALF
jgi:hypothetical protein